MALEEGGADAIMIETMTEMEEAAAGQSKQQKIILM
jgi:methionine synthase I (cobalamin-dependent)